MAFLEGLKPRQVRHLSRLEMRLVRGGSLTSRHTNTLLVLSGERPLSHLEMRPICGALLTSTLHPHQNEWLLPRVTLSFREVEWAEFRAKFALKVCTRVGPSLRPSSRPLNPPFAMPSTAPPGAPLARLDAHCQPYIQAHQPPPRRPGTIALPRLDMPRPPLRPPTSRHTNPRPHHPPSSTRRTQTW